MSYIILLAVWNIYFYRFLLKNSKIPLLRSRFGLPKSGLISGVVFILNSE